MKSLKLILISLGILVVILLLVAFLLPGKVHIEQSADFKSSPEQVFEQVDNLKKWKEWSTWLQLDTAAKITYEGPEKGSGASYTWSSENPDLGSGRLSIASSIPSELIKFNLDFFTGHISTGEFTFKEIENGTRVTWTLDSDLGYNPLSRWMGVFMKSWIEQDFATGLENIKNIVENLPAPKASSIQLENMDGFTAITITDTTDIHNFTNRLGQLIPQIYMSLEMQGISQEGPAFTIYHKWSDDTVIIETGIPVSSDAQPVIEYPLKRVEIPGRRVAVTNHKGSLNTEATHYEIMDWVEENNYEFAGPPVEVSITDPSSVNDSTEWVTRIYYPVSE